MGVFGSFKQAKRGIEDAKKDVQSKHRKGTVTKLDSKQQKNQGKSK